LCPGENVRFERGLDGSLVTVVTQEGSTVRRGGGGVGNPQEVRREERGEPVLSQTCFTNSLKRAGCPQNVKNEEARRKRT